MPSFLDNIKIVSAVFTEMTPITKGGIMAKYDMLAEAILHRDSNLVTANIDMYNILLNETLYTAIVKSYSNMQIVSQYDNYSQLMDRVSPIDGKGDKIALVRNKFLSEYHFNVMEEYIDNNTITNALNSFGLKEATGINTDEIEEQIVDTPLEDNFDDLFDDEIDDIISDKDIFGDDVDTLDNIDDDSEEFSVDEIMNSDKTDEDSSNNKDDSDNGEDDYSSEKEMLDAWRKAEWVNISTEVESILGNLTTLYKSGIESIPHAGLFLDFGCDKSPLVVIETSANDKSVKPLDRNVERHNKLDSGYMVDTKIMDILKKYLTSLTEFKGIDPKTGFPTLEALYNNNGVMMDAHLMFQSANIKFSGAGHNKNSIRRWATETKGDSHWIDNNNASSARLCKWRDVKDWYKWVIENTLFRYFNDAGLSPSKPSGYPKIIEITSLFASKLRNVVAVSERVNRGKKLETTELKILTDSALNVDELTSALSNNLNLGNAKDITTSWRPAGNQVNTITVVYDQAAANASTKFAAEIIDSVIESGNDITWNNVLLGRSQNGEFLFFDKFMASGDASDRAYAIYAGSGAGKGNMTLTLMAAAIVDNKQLFYTDGKPDSGISIAAEAWKLGKEMYMFDGQAESSFPFNPYFESNAVSCNMRNIDDVTAYSKFIPKGILKSDADTREFLGVCRYLRSISLFSKVMIARQTGKLAKDNWQIWVFDEMTNMSKHECSVRRLFASYISGKGYKFAITSKDGDDNLCIVGLKPCKELNEAVDTTSSKYDEGVAYIKNWLDWTSQISIDINTVNTIALRLADANLFFIFQNAQWLATDGDITTIAKVVTQIKCRKFIGKNALANNCGFYGDGNTLKKDWYETVSSGGGWWAVSSTADIRKDNNVQVFKPYSIWGFKKPGSTDDDYKFFNYYINKIAGGSVGDTLQTAWDYANSAIVELAQQDVIISASNLKDYIYNVQKFAPQIAEYDPSKLSNASTRGGMYDKEEESVRFNTPLDDEYTTDEEAVTRKSDDELKQFIINLLGTVDTSNLSDAQMHVIIDKGVELLRNWGW